MPPPPHRRLVRAGSSTSTDSQQTKARKSQEPAPEVPATTNLAQAGTSAAAGESAGPASAAAAGAVAAAEPLAHTQTCFQLRPGLNPSPTQPDSSAQYVGKYQQQNDEEDVDILGDPAAVPLTVDAQEPAAAEAEVPAAAAEEAPLTAAVSSGVEAEPTQEVPDAPAGGRTAPAAGAAKPLPASTF